LVQGPSFPRIGKSYRYMSTYSLVTNNCLHGVLSFFCNDHIAFIRL
jgi:hypothetical protein